MLHLKLKTLIKRAKDNGACDSHLAILSQYQTTEDALLDSKAPYWICWYLRFVIKNTDKKCEAFLLGCHPRFLSHYIKFIKKARWAEAEELIKGDAEFACYYATDCLQRRWPEAEATISSSKKFWNLYAEAFGIEEEQED
jgi:hypothetical protein